MKCVKRLTADQQRLAEENLTIVERVLRFDINANPCVAGLGYEDLYQEGCVWLCNAALTFDPARGSFASYARQVVQNGLVSYCRNLTGKQSRMISLAEMEPTAGWPHGSSGNKKWINGVIFLVNASITPARSPIFKIPVQKDMIPSMVMHRLTASPADWKAASVTAWMFPLKLPYMIPAIIMNAQSPFSILVCPWSFFHYMKKIG